MEEPTWLAVVPLRNSQNIFWRWRQFLFSTRREGICPPIPTECYLAFFILGLIYRKLGC